MLIAVLFTAMIVPIVLVANTALTNIKSESLEQYQQLSQSIQKEIDNKVSGTLQQFDHSFQQISQSLPLENNKLLPGLIGYFHLDSEGRLSSPLLPVNRQQWPNLSLTQTEIELRLNNINKLYDILSLNHVVSENPYMGEMASQHKKNKVPLITKSTNISSEQRTKGSLPAKNKKATTDKKTAKNTQPLASQQRLAFKANVLPSGHLMLHRATQKQGQWLIEGSIIEIETLINNFISIPHKESSLATFSNFTYSYQGQPVSAVTHTEQLHTLARFQLAEPFQELTMAIKYQQLPKTEGALYTQVLSALLVLVATIGFTLLYLLLAEQVSLLQRQQGFISAMSHELKTPITSIKMYGDILQRGWLDESKKNQYYQYITDEADRLSRLIDNVLHASKITQNNLTLELHPITANELVGLINAKTRALFQQSNYKCNVELASGAENCSVLVDTDAFSQIMINLVDNAIKYSKENNCNQVDIKIEKGNSGYMKVKVRDYGIGIEQKEIDKIFDLFYRVGNELTRTSKGTGLGLSLVKELIELMSGSVYAVRREEGTEFVVLIAIITN
ncbi:MAG: HAMP domain-containing histidine kinase [Thalassotalea sp.]|nr:HAMP domain-containing histidine kinase [Thalassotalea sp.]